MADHTQAQLEEMIEGKSPNPRAIFFEHAALNVPKSKEAGRRIYDKQIFIKLTQVGVTDSVSYMAQKEDIANYTDEYAYFLKNRQGVRQPAIEIIPNLDIAHLQELRDMGLLTIPKLAEAEIVPPHLEYAHNAAKVFNKALEDTSHVEEKSIEEVTEDRTETKTLPQADRQQHGHDDGRSEVPRSVRPEQVTGTPKGDETGRRTQRHNGVAPLLDPNWSISIG